MQLVNGMFSPIPAQKPQANATQNGMFSPIPMNPVESALQKRESLKEAAKSNSLAKRVEKKPADTKDEKPKSAADRTKEFLDKYRENQKNATMKMDPISMQENISVALRDPVYGQATATGLAAGQNLLNSWIAGNNAKARKDAEDLANQRWIKQMEDAAESQDYQRKWSEDERAHRLEREKIEDDWRRERAGIEDKRYEDQFFSPGQQFEFNPMNVDDLKKDPQAQELIKILGEDVYAKSAAEKAVAENRKVSARKKLELLSEAAKKSLTTQRPNAEQLDSYGFWNHVANWGGLNIIDWKTRSDVNAENAMRNSGYRTFSNFNPTAYLKEAEDNIRSGNIELGVQQKKIYEAVRILANAHRMTNSIKISPDGSTIVVAGPWGSKVITPKNAEAIARQFELSAGE